MSKLKLWFAASRPVSFTAAIVPVVVGTLLVADDHFSWWKALLAILGSVAFLAGTNFVNDYYDYKKGVDGEHSLGQAGFIQKGIVAPKQVLAAGIICFIAGAGIGLVLCAVTSWALLWIGVASLLAGFLYTGWPVHLAYIGLGEVTVFIFMGPVMVLGGAFVQVQRWEWQAAVVSLPIAFLVTGILHANNLRDIENDRATGKRTIASIIGREWANREMYFLLAATYVSVVIAAVVGALPWVGLIVLATMPLAWPIVQVVRTSTNPRKLNMALFHTAQLHMRFGAVLALGLLANWVYVSL